MSTRVIHIRDRHKTHDEVYIGRKGHGEDGYFGNEHNIGDPRKPGSKCPLCSTTQKPVFHNRPDCIAAFKHDFWKRVNVDPVYRARVEALKDKTLLCFCDPLPCHGHVYRDWLDKGCPLASQVK